MNDLRLQHHGQALVAYVDAANMQASKTVQLKPAIDAAVADIQLHLACEEKESCLSGRANGGRGTVTRTLEPIAKRSIEISAQLNKGDATRRAGRTDILQPCPVVGRHRPRLPRRIAGAGGKGGVGALCGTTPAGSGSVGGAALRTLVPVTLVNEGAVWGGGGGGGARSSLGGGGGAGLVVGAGGTGAGDVEGPTTGSAGSMTKGGMGAGTPPTVAGAGGDPGQPGIAGADDVCGTTNVTGGAGGAAGPAALGNSFISWSVVGDRKGPLN